MKKLLLGLVLVAGALIGLASAEKIYVPVAANGQPINDSNLAGVNWTVIRTSGPVQVSSAPCQLDFVMFPGTAAFTYGTDMFYCFDTSGPWGVNVGTWSGVGFSSTTSKYGQYLNLVCSTGINSETYGGGQLYPGFSASPYPIMFGYGLSVGFWTAAEAAGVTVNEAVVGWRPRNER